MKLFPPEIIEYTAESHFARSTTTSRMVYMVVLAALVLSFASLPFIYVDITTQAQGIIRTPSENNELQAVIYGEVQHVFVSENTIVERGDTILTLNTDKLDEQIVRLQAKIVENKQFVEDISMLLNKRNHRLITHKYQAEYSAYTSILADNNTQIAYFRTEYELHLSLYEKGVTPKQEYLQYKNQYENAVNLLENKKQQYLSNWEAERTRLEIENNEVVSSKKQLQEEKVKYVIKAPCSGSVIQFAGIQEGSFIGPSKTIALITNNDDLMVECYVSPLDIGYLQQGQKAIFQMSSFDYNQWGLAHGTVTEISKDILSINNQSIFCVRCSLDEKNLELKNGYKGQLKKGMTLTGRFYLTERTLWQLLFDKVDDWVNPKLVSDF